MAIAYHIYGNDGAGGSVDYSTILATVSTLSWSPPPLAAPSDNTFAVRAYDTVTGREDRNTDAAVRIVIDAAGNDITARPKAPVALSVTPTAAGGAHVGWQYDPAGQAGAPTGFHVYVAAGAPPSCTPGSQAATVAYALGRIFFADLAGLTDGVTYFVIVRAFNATAEEPNTTATTVTADAAGPLPVASLTATPTA